MPRRGGVDHAPWVGHQVAKFPAGWAFFVARGSRLLGGVGRRYVVHPRHQLPETRDGGRPRHGSRGTPPPTPGRLALGSYAWVRRCGWVQDTGLGTVQAPIAAGAALMAQKVTVALEDDLTGGPAAET